jgi:hypothetical protein
LPSLPQSSQCATAHWLVTRWGEEARAARPGDWRTWNHSQTNARRLVREDEARLRALACAPEAAAPTVSPSPGNSKTMPASDLLTR